MVELALINANVRTMNPSQPLAQAVGIKGNQILKVGSTLEIDKLVEKNTRIINLRGKTLVPGFIDTHIHVADFGRCLMWLDLSAADSIRSVQALLKEKTKQTLIGKWIIGRGWNENNFKEKRMLSKMDIDQVAKDHPVILYHGASYLCIANSKALSIAGITNQTIAPTGGTIDKTSRDELTGVFRDNATNLIWKAVSKPTLEELSDAVELACQKILEAGITSVDWIILEEHELSLIQALYAKGKLPIRVYIITPYEFLKAVSFKSKDPTRLKLGGAIIFADGYLDSKTAALQKPYNDDPNNMGRMNLSEEELSDSTAKVLEMDLQPTIHAMGDRAIDIALNIIENSPKTARFRIEQAAVLNPELIKRLSAQNIVVSVQPQMVPTEFNVWHAIEHLGSERAKWLHPLKTLLQEGIKIAAGSDCPMEPLNPLLGIQDVVARESHPEQRVSVDQALKMYTLDAAYCSREEKIKGSIQEGKLADLTVLANDPTEVPIEKIKDIPVLMTIIDGKVVYSNL
jgi:predicted amidohydrolase YtcJ